MAPRTPAAVDARRRVYLAALAFLFGAEWVILGLAPWYRQDWALENALVAVMVVALAASYRRLPLSRLSYTLSFVFLTLHEVGAHYTYSEVPYDPWVRALTGRSLDAAMRGQRDEVDRVGQLGC